MTTPLQINGMTFAIEEGSLEEKQVEIGMRKRAIDGTPWGIIQSVRKEYSFSSTWLTIEEAGWWKYIFGGQGQGFTASFDAGTNTDQGHRASGEEGVLGSASDGVLCLNLVSSPECWYVPWPDAFGTDWAVLFRATSADYSGVWMHTPNYEEEGWFDVVQLAGDTHSTDLQTPSGRDGILLYDAEDAEVYIYSVMMFNRSVPVALQAGLGAYLYNCALVASPSVDLYGDLTGLLHKTGQVEYTGSTFTNTPNGIYEKISVEVKL